MRQIPRKRSARRAHSEGLSIEVDVHEEDVARIEALARALTVNDETSKRLRAEIESLLNNSVAVTQKDLH
jgi:hypothetical protein